MPENKDFTAARAAMQARLPSEQNATPPPGFAEKVKPISLEWLDTEPPPRTWLATAQDEDTERTFRRKRGFIARGELHVLAGEGGAGKGRWATQMALSIAASEDYGIEGIEGLLPATPLSSRLYADIHPSKGKVLLLLGEDDALEMQNRVFGAAKEERWNSNQKESISRRLKWRSFRGEDFRLVELSRDGTVSPSQSIVELGQYLEDEAGEDGWALIVIDPLARFLGAGEENDNAAMHAAAAQVEKLCEAPGRPAVLLVAHTRKPSDPFGKSVLTQHDVRGASAVVNAARLVMALQPFRDSVKIYPNGSIVSESKNEGECREISESGTRLHVVKNNLSAKSNPVSLFFGKYGGLRSETESEEKERRKEQYKGGAAVKASSKKSKDKSESDISLGGLA